MHEILIFNLFFTLVKYSDNQFWVDKHKMSPLTCGLGCVKTQAIN